MSSRRISYIIGKYPCSNDSVLTIKSSFVLIQRKAETMWGCDDQAHARSDFYSSQEKFDRFAQTSPQSELIILSPELVKVFHAWTVSNGRFGILPYYGTNFNVTRQTLRSCRGKPTGVNRPELQLVRLIFLTAVAIAFIQVMIKITLSNKTKPILCKGFVISVWLPVETCSWDRQFTYFVWKVTSSLIIYIWFMWYIVVFRCVLKRCTNPCMFPTFWVCIHTGRIPPRRCIYWPDCRFNFWRNNVINGGRNCILYPIFNCINKIAHFPINSFIKTPLQGFHIHSTFINHHVITRSTNGKIWIALRVENQQ